MPRGLATTFLVSEHLFSVLNCHTVSLIAKQEQIRFNILFYWGNLTGKLTGLCFKKVQYALVSSVNLIRWHTEKQSV